MEKKCLFCGESFTPSSRGERGSGQKFCSRSCGCKGAKPSRDVVCVDCGVKFTYHGRGQCKRCPECRALKLRERSEAWRREYATKYTDVGSGGAQWGEQNHQWKDGLSEYVGAYRSRCFKVHPRHCNICGNDKKRLDVHHINGDKTDCDIDNLVPLCRSCHKSVHYAIAATPQQMTDAFNRVRLAKVKSRKITGTPGSG